MSETIQRWTASPDLSTPGAWKVLDRHGRVILRGATHYQANFVAFEANQEFDRIVERRPLSIEVSYPVNLERLEDYFALNDQVTLTICNRGSRYTFRGIPDYMEPIVEVK